MDVLRRGKKTINFTKMQGAGNDFILIETNTLKENWSKKAAAMCDRHFGIGGDGLLLVMSSKKADIKMRMFNPDGSEAEACGNGLRCIVKYALERKLVKPKAGSLTVETGAGIRRAKYQEKNGKITEIQVAMGKPELLAEKIPVAVEAGREKELDIKSPLSYRVNVQGRKLRLYFVSMGNPHGVYFASEPVKDFPLSEIGPRIEHHRIFPKRVNFEIVRVISRKEMEVRVWERGAGETLACGTGACAVAVAANLLGYTGKKVNIKLPGGKLNVEWSRGGEVLLGGPTETVFSGAWTD